MPTPCYLKLNGENQGNIEGSVTIQGHQNTILVQGVDWKVNIPRNPQTGLPAGKRVHNPLTVIKEVDKSSPKLYQALTSGEHMKTVTLDFFRTNDKGAEEKYYTVELDNAIIVSIRPWVPNCLDTKNRNMGHMENVSFTYEKVVVTWQPDGIETEDSWLAPKT